MTARERNIREKDVEYVVGNPEIKYADVAGNPVLVSEIGGRALKVVVSKDDENFVITTAWRD